MSRLLVIFMVTNKNDEEEDLDTFFSLFRAQGFVRRRLSVGDNDL